MQKDRDCIVNGDSEKVGALSDNEIGKTANIQGTGPEPIKDDDQMVENAHNSDKISVESVDLGPKIESSPEKIECDGKINNLDQHVSDDDDDREKSCSSSDKIPEGNILRKLDSPEKLPEESVTSSGKNETTQDMETSQVTQQEANTEKEEEGLCDFDLNQEVCSDDTTDGPANQNSTPVPEIDSSNQQLGFLDFDLNNVAENDADTRNGMSESSIETNSRKSERLELDLNLASGDGGGKIDLNIDHQPYIFLNDSSDNSYLKSKQSQNYVKSDESVISIMGTRVEVNRKDSVIPYSGEPAMSFSSPMMYGSSGPVPYMVEYSRETPAMPQLVDSTAFSQPPFFINTTSLISTNGSGPVGPSRGSRDPSGFSQFLNSGQVRSMDEQMRSNVVSGKRKEPENGFENYPFKQYM